MSSNMPSEAESNAANVARPSTSGSANREVSVHRQYSRNTMKTIYLTICKVELLY